MAALLVVLLAVVATLRNSSPGVNCDDEDLVQQFRELFSEFLPKSNQERASKRIRDISKVKQKQLNGKPQREFKPASDRARLSPLYNCNHFDVDSRLCINVRQLGTTLTVGVRVEGKEKEPINWYRVYKVRGRGEQGYSFVKFTKESVPWNINIGGDDNELRISPITETDFSYNFFLATLDKGDPDTVKKKGHQQLLMFSIEPINIDMGSLYHGEEITISVRSHMELPALSVLYEWSRVGGVDFGVVRNLPSNMKLSRDGSAIVIKEHRSRTDVTLTCAVYTNRNFTLGKRNFFLRKVASAKDPHLEAGNEPTMVRKRRFLDEFYADLLPKSKRDATDENDDFQSSEDFPDLESPTPSPHFYTVQTPRDSAAVLNFYGGPFTNSPLSDAGSETGTVTFRQGTAEEGPQTLDELIEEANAVVEESPVVSEDGRQTIDFVEHERPRTFEDEESMLIADCDRGSDCGANAICTRIRGSKKFCRCKAHYRGNGLFCWSF